MDFLSKILQRKPAKSGAGGCSNPASTPVAVNKSDHEAHVQFAREFVVELVETVPKKSEKAALTKHLEEEDVVSVKSVTPSEGSLQSGISVAGSTSLPDLLQPEFVYKKQTDTDTDTTEYESAAEIDPLDAGSPVGSLIARDLLSGFQGALDEKGKVTESAAAGSPVEPAASNKAESIESSIISSEFEKTFEYKTVTTDNSVSRGSESSSLSEAYEDAGDTAVKTSAGELKVKALDISGLCLCIGNLCLDSPRRTEKGNLSFDNKDSVYNSNSSSDISIPVSKIDIIGSGKCTQVTNQLEVFSRTSCGDSTFFPENSEESGLGVLKNLETTNKADGVESPQKFPVLFEAAKTFDSGAFSVEDNLPALVENGANTTRTVKIDRNVEAEVSKTVIEHNHADIHQAVAESNEIQDEIPFVVEYSEKAVSKESDIHNTENIQVCQCIVTINEAQENHVVDVTKGFRKSDIVEKICLTEAEDINSAPAKSTTPIGIAFDVEEPLLSTNVTDSVEETENCLRGKSLQDLDSTWTSTSHEDLIVEKEAVSQFTDSAVHNKSEPEAGIALTSAEVPDISDLIVAPIPATFAHIEAGEWKLPVETEQLQKVVKETPTVLNELFEICNRQQKDLELDSEKFVDGTEFFSSPSKPGNLSEKVEFHVPHSPVPSKLKESVFDQPAAGEFEEFDQTIADEAESILQEIMNSSSECYETALTESDNRHLNSTQQTNLLNITKVMADAQRVSSSTAAVDETSVGPFVCQASLHRSPPPYCKTSPRSSSSVPSPCESQCTKSKMSSINAVKGGSPCNHVSGGASPSTCSGKNSPDHRTSCNKESSPKSSVNPEVNQSEAGPEIADTQLYSRDVFQDPAAFEYLSSVGSSHVASDLRKESLYVKFDPLVGGVCRTTDKSLPLPPSVETKSSVPAATSSGEEHQSGNTTPVKNPALSVIDKLISLSPSPLKSCQISPTEQPVISPVKESVPASDRQVAADSCSGTVIRTNETIMEELYLLRKLCATQDEKYKERMAQLEREIVTCRGHVENLQSLVKESEERETKLNEKMVEKAQAQKQTSIIMEEYEKTISRLVADKEQERQAHELDKAELLKDRDAAMGHLANIEIAFSDLHKKYERSKAVIEDFKKNEEVLRASLAEYEATIRKQEQKYDMLKSHAMAQLESANQELDSVRRSQQAETAKLKAMLKKAEVKASSLEEMLEQKIKENQELASICDDLISRVGGSE
ncbi:hypothetical protein B7P43_G05932 [Cryptotermes secundus]|uniref:Transforming acidic coiled-coil-containing protein C-terminal domain-containing protein n=1 Tax=Cryptotermes secundus TaxID=105785 RepID=A0A2J7QA67_9NEOP|nr:transforming acidic coiled-coil-containing protein 3 isoform X2 [Cryptotermes secundus]PNF25490.1 hypothetical protein B7P43_G05932 [Cryptotermes secundus]